MERRNRKTGNIHPRRRRRTASFDNLEARLAPAVGSIQGALWNDLNADKVRDPGEPALAGRTVYLDLDRDGRLDGGEPSTMTAGDGSYAFNGLQPGAYHVSQVLPDGWQQTSPGEFPTRGVLLQEAVETHTFDFQELASSTSYEMMAYHRDGYTIDSSVNNGISKFRVTGSTDSGRYGGSAALKISFWPAWISLRRDDGAPFDLSQMDLAETWSSVYTPTVIFHGTKADGRVVQQSFTLDNVFNNTNAFQTFTFSGFDDVVSVDWFTNDSYNAHQFDDVRVDAGGGLGAIGIDLGSAAMATPDLTITDYENNEANGGTYSLSVDVRLSSANTLPVNVYYATADGNATAGQDYEAQSGRLVFQPGETTKRITVRTTPDTRPEPDETILINLWGAVNARIADDQGVITLLNDDGPIARNDSYAAEDNTTLTVAAPGVLANDDNGGTRTAVLWGDPGHGDVTLNADGSFVYVPDSGYVGNDSFTYRLEIDGVPSKPATVSITVNQVNDPPVALDDSYSTTQDGTLVVGGVGVPPVLRYGFDEVTGGTVAAQDTGTTPAAPGTLVGQATRTASTPGGASSSALDLGLSGKNYVTTGTDTDKVDTLTTLTLSGWINLRRPGRGRRDPQRHARDITDTSGRHRRLDVGHPRAVQQLRSAVREQLRPGVRHLGVVRDLRQHDEHQLSGDRRRRAMGLRCDDTIRRQRDHVLSRRRDDDGRATGWPVDPGRSDQAELRASGSRRYIRHDRSHPSRLARRPAGV